MVSLERRRQHKPAAVWDVVVADDWWWWAATATARCWSLQLHQHNQHSTVHFTMTTLSRHSYSVTLHYQIGWDGRDMFQASTTMTAWQKFMVYKLEGVRPPRGRPKKTWRELWKKHCWTQQLNKEDAINRSKWRKLILCNTHKDRKWVSEWFFSGTGPFGLSWIKGC